ncbi:MAG: Hsp20/alpha crystallin family protein [Deltaproteobacteria bacterium]|nr:Hsp20/alpha crystallin family protein [Deltaproteobacteria bacterium]
MRNPPRDLLERLRYFEKQVEDLFRRLFEDQLAPAALANPGAFPAVDVIEEEGSIWVRADVPGVDRSSLELFAGPQFLVLRGTKPAPESRWSYLRVERSYGPFQRMVLLPAAGDPSSIRAGLERGVLEIQIPKMEERRRGYRRIPIE